MASRTHNSLFQLGNQKIQDYNSPRKELCFRQASTPTPWRLFLQHFRNPIDVASVCLLGFCLSLHFLQGANDGPAMALLISTNIAHSYCLRNSQKEIWPSYNVLQNGHLFHFLFTIFLHHLAIYHCELISFLHIE